VGVGFAEEYIIAYKFVFVQWLASAFKAC